MFILNQLWYVEMKLDKLSKYPYPTVMLGVCVAISIVSIVVFTVFGISALDKKNVVASDPLWSQVLKSCWQREAVPVHECVEVAYQVKRVLDPDMPEVITEDVPNHNSGPSSAILSGPSGNCQSSTGPITSIDPKCQVYHKPEDIRTYGDLQQYR